jgi:Ca2+/Na+ antiporter
VSVALNILIALAVLALILTRQLRRRPVREEQPYRIMLVLGVVGLVETVQFHQHHDVSTSAWALLVASLAVGAGFGALRGMTVHVWREAGTLYRQGNVATLVLWIVGLGLHLSVDLLIKRVDADAAGLSNTAILLYLAITLGAQQALVLERAQHLAAEA